MKIPKIWCVVCALFCVYSLSILISEKFDVTYLPESIESSALQLGCRALKDFYPNETTIDFVQLKVELYQHFFNGSSKARKDWPSKKTEPSDFRIWNNLACWIVDSYSFDFKIPKLRYIYKHLGFQADVYVLDEDTFDMVRIDFKESYNQLVVLNRDRPHSRCRKNNQRFRCLNECFKERFRLSRYYYDSSETGLVHLNYLKANESVEKQETSCFEKCKSDDCKIAKFISDTNFKRFEIHGFKAHLVMGEFDYWIQLIGLISLILDISFYKLILLIFRSVESKVNDHRIRRCLSYLKLAILSISFVFLSYVFVTMVLDFNEQRENPARKVIVTNLIRPDTRIDLVLCFSERSFKFFHINFNLSFSELEKKTTETADHALEAITLDYQNRTSRISYNRVNKVMFLLDGYEISRCLWFAVYPAEPAYQSLFSISKLRIKVNDSLLDFRLFLLTEDEAFNQNSFSLEDGNAFRKSVERSNKKCIEYKANYVHLNCTSRGACLDHCLTRRFIDQHHNISVEKGHQLVIDKDHFSSDQWKTFYPTGERAVYKDALDKCHKEIPNDKACIEAKFEGISEIWQEFKSTWEIDLFYEVYQSTEKLPSWYKLLLDISNLLSILYGLTAFKLLKLTSVKLKIGKNKIVRFLIYFLCSIGFTYHTYQVFDSIMNGLDQSQYYALHKTVKMPLLVFCFNYDSSLIDRNHQLTGNYLKSLTQEISANAIFSNITYLDKRNEWCGLDLQSIEFFFFVDKKCFSIRTGVEEYHQDQFYFSNDKKVLRMNFNKLREEIRPVHFNKFGEVRPVHFMSKTRDAIQFSKILSLQFRDFYINSRIYVDKKYEVSQESFVVVYEDKFLELKLLISDPLSFFRDQNNLNDVDAYLGRLVQNYKETHQLATLNLPINETQFNLEIDDDLFAQFYSQVQNKSDYEQPANLNYRREFDIHHVKQFEEYEDDFSFYLDYFSKVVIFTNEDSYPKLILNLLNVLSIWFHCGVLDLHVFVFKPLRLIRLTYKLLTKLKSLLRRSMALASLPKRS